MLPHRPPPRHICCAAFYSRTGQNTWTGPITLSVDSSIRSDNLLILSAVIGGAGALTKTGPGTLTLGGSASNTHGGNTFVNEGVVLLVKDALLQAVPHDLIIGTGLPGAPFALVQYLSTDQVWANITVNGNSLLDLNGFDEYAGDLTLNQGGDVQTLAGSLYVNGVNGVTVNPGTNTTSTISGRLGFDAVKIHNLYAVKNTPLADQVERGEVTLMERDAYIATLIDFLELLPPAMLVERISGDAPPDYFIGPAWCLDKPAVKLALEAELARRDTWQGKRWTPTA